MESSLKDALKEAMCWVCCMCLMIPSIGGGIALLTSGRAEARSVLEENPCNNTCELVETGYTSNGGTWIRTGEQYECTEPGSSQNRE